MSETSQRQAWEVAQRAATALGVENAVCNLDFMETDRGVGLLEFGGRIGATGLPEIIEMHFGVDLYAVALDLALGVAPTIRVDVGAAAAALLIRSPRSGTLSRCAVPEVVEENPEVHAVSFDYQPGDSVRAFRTGPDRIGAIFASGRTAEEAEQTALFAFDHLDIAVASDDGVGNSGPGLRCGARRAR